MVRFERRRILSVGTLLLASIAFNMGDSKRATAAEDFYLGKQIHLVVASDPGGGYDAYARLLARHWADHIPGKPNIIIENMPGVGGLKTMNFIAHVAPKDGLTVGAVQNGIGYEPLMGISGGKQNAQFDLLKMNWLGSMTKEVAVGVFYNPSPVQSLDDLKSKEVTVGTTGPSVTSTTFPLLMNALLGTKFKIVEGYPNTAPIWLAMERGELQGTVGIFYSSLLTSKSDWLRDNKLTFVIQMALAKHPDLPNVPLLYDYAKTTAEKQEMVLALAPLLMGRPYVLPDGVPSDRVQILSDAFMATMKDPALLADAKQMHLEIDPIDGSAVKDVLQKMFDTPQPIVDDLAKIFIPANK